MKIKNWIENTIIAVAVAVVALFVFNEMKFKPMRQQFERQIAQQTLLIERLSMQEKYSISNTFERTKAKDGEIKLSVNSEMGVNTAAPVDSVLEEKERSWWDKIWGR
ncbi:MAG: hypothetical protein ACK5LR_03960 [Mangrovibacterium sp.]